MKSVRIAIALLALVVGITAYVSAVPESKAIIITGPHVCSYYSNKKFTTVVGARGEGCCNSVISWGVTTSYVRCQELLCPDVMCDI